MSFRHKEEISAEFFADEIFFPGWGTEVQRPEQIAINGDWNRRILEL